jgi:hypothetical protein
MALDVAKLRKLVAMDESDPLSRFALGKKLLETYLAEGPGGESGGPSAASPLLTEAAEHLSFANRNKPDHLATYHILGQVLTHLGRRDEARRVFEAGIGRVAGVGEGMGRDLGPAMQRLMDEL